MFISNLVHLIFFSNFLNNFWNVFETEKKQAWNSTNIWKKKKYLKKLKQGKKKILFQIQSFFSSFRFNFFVV